MTIQSNVKILPEVDGFIMPQNDFFSCLNYIHKGIFGVGRKSSLSESTHQHYHGDECVFCKQVSGYAVNDSASMK